ncbi:MAG: glycosyltransferase family 39 protein [Deltaproteobacteria bacterium]|nr:glycosyltransferase family 39 protein [Deltaproteobacteria bacterium]
MRAGPVDLPYYWDEADVYAPGARWVAEHGLDIRPGVFPDDYSRGHPPLLYLLAGIAFSVFGPGPATGHLLVLPFAVLALLGTYLLGRDTWGRPAGIAAAALLAATPLFASIAAMLLPEIALCSLAALALWLFARGRLVLAAVASALAVLVKETGLFVPLALAGALGIEALRDRALGKARTWAGIGICLSPALALAAFFVWQKLLAGYFIFPHHQNLFWQRPFYAEDVLTVFPSLVLWHGRWLLMAAAAGLALACLLVPDWRRICGRPEPEAAGPRARPRRSSVAVAVLLLVLGNAVFFAKMFYLERYALPAHPGLLVIACAALLHPAALELPIGAWWRWARWAPIAGAWILGLCGLYAAAPPDRAELTFAYADVIATHEQAAAAIEARGGQLTVLSSWPMTVELRHPYLGYVGRPQTALHIDAWRERDPRPRIDLVLCAEGSRHAEALRAEAAARGFELLERFQLGHARALALYGQRAGAGP